MIHTVAKKINRVHKSGTFLGRANDTQNAVCVTSGTWGPASRYLSAQMRKSVEVIFDIETSHHVVFQSGKMKYKHDPASNSVPQICCHTPDTIGECAIFFEKCAYQNDNFLKRVTYSVQEARLRSFIIGISGVVN